MARPIQNEVTGPGAYRYLCQYLYLQIVDCIADDDRFHQLIQALLSVARPITNANKEAWDKAMREVLVDEDGDPLGKGDELERVHRYEQLAVLMELLHKEGVFNVKSKPIEDATDLFKKAMQRDEDDDVQAP